jgi:hypothetical protein
MGVLDIPAPVFQWLDSLLLEGLPATGRLAAWALLASMISMGLYRLLSPQKKIRRIRQESGIARRAVMRYEGDFGGLLPLINYSLALSLKHLGSVLMPVVLASLPVLSLLVWLSTAYGHRFPGDGQEVEILLFPETVEVTWTASHRDARARGVWQVVWPASGEVTHLRGQDGRLLLSLPLDVPVPIIHKPQWWNKLIDNPAGYLPAESSLEKAILGLPKQEILDFGPVWMRSWEVPFLTLLVAFSLTFKWLFRIQ